MLNTLKAAAPTTTAGPSVPAGCPSEVSVSMTASRISGAEEPRAMRERVATTQFQTAEGPGGPRPRARVCGVG
jgi:hypothetical protein